MLDGLKRLFGSSEAAGKSWEDVAPWAQARGLTFRVVQAEGFVVDGKLLDSKQNSTPWRMEWGPSQRPYITGPELRLRCELGLGSELQVLLMNRVLQEHMEKTVFEQYVEGVQTRIDNQTPPEMRWLVMFPKLPGSEMPLLRDRFVAVASIKSWLQRWLDGPLMQALASHRTDPTTPLVLMIGRGRLMLRTALADADPAELERWLRLFECTIREAQRAVREDPNAPAPDAAGKPWSASALPGDERDG
jgi:hypothetical protein